MRKLFLVRHGQTHPAQNQESDLERRLTPQGESDIRSLRNTLEKVISGDTAYVCSPALRARQTAGLLTIPEQEPRLHAELYHGMADDYLDVIARYIGHESVIVVGHNPVISRLSWQLSSGGTGGFSPGTCVEFTYPDAASASALLKPVGFLVHPVGGS